MNFHSFKTECNHLVMITEFEAFENVRIQSESGFFGAIKADLLCSWQQEHRQFTVYTNDGQKFICFVLDERFDKIESFEKTKKTILLPQWEEKCEDREWKREISHSLGFFAAYSERKTFLQRFFGIKKYPKRKKVLPAEFEYQKYYEPSQEEFLLNDVVLVFKIKGTKFVTYICE